MARSPARAKDADLQAIVALAESFDYEEGHSRQVARLALRLFDDLRSLHGLGNEERSWLHCAALLHDIGVDARDRGHHKEALRLVLGAREWPLGERERLVIAGIARYHRKALPSTEHDHFAALEPEDRPVVRTLAGLLRVADGLDRCHGDDVRDLSCRVDSDRVVVRCRADAPCEEERAAALKKADLFEEVFGRRLDIVWESSGDTDY